MSNNNKNFLFPAKLGKAVALAGLASVLAAPASFAEQKVSVATISNQQAEQGKTALLSLLKQVEFFSANFSQKVFDQSGSLLQKGSGKLSVKKPNLVNWHTISPDELNIISDGANIWFYDPFIEQATVYNFHNALSNTPVLLLTSNDKQLWDGFTVTKVDASNAADKSVRFSIKAKNDNSQVKNLVLSFADTANNTVPKLSQLTFEDATGQLSVIDLSEVNHTTLPAKKLFEFTLPQGVSLDDQR